MSKFGKITIGLSATLAVGLVATFFFLRHLVTKSFPVTDGTLTTPGLHAPVDVYRDEYGIPHISATDEHDMAFAAGFVHAQDRLWQMDLMRRAGQGRLSEILGTPTVDVDKLFRTINLPRVADSILSHMHPAARLLLEEYSEGVNAFITTHHGRYPVECDMLNYDPEEWTPAHSILLSRLLAWELNLAWWTDLTYGEIAGLVSPEQLREIIPAYPDSLLTRKTPQQQRLTGELHQVLETARTYRSIFHLGEVGGGSNGWVVSGARSVSGKPILANDPHLAMPAPSRWYEMHLSAPGWNVSGASIPGVPVIVIGHNNACAWGLTNAMIDDADFFIEKPDTSQAGKYIFGKSSLPFEEREEKILVRGTDSVIFVARSTIHGPVISDVHPSSKHHGESSAVHGMPVSMKWTGLEVSDEINGFRLMNLASTAEEFEEGVKEISVPGQAIVYADTSGTIAGWTSGRIPIRGKQMPMLPADGSTGDNEWKGWVPFAKMPKLRNPAEGFIAFANQRVGDNSFYVSTLWEPSSRIARIRELLQSTEKFSADDFKQFQQDVTSPYAHDIVNIVLHDEGDSASADPEVARALTYLRNWDDRFLPSDIATTIFNSFFVHLLRNTFEDELGSDVFRDFVFFGAIPYRVEAQLLSNDSSAWFTNVKTGVKQSRSGLIHASLRDALSELRKESGPEMKNWRWGSVHTVTFHHPFGSRKPLDRIFDLGPFPLGGGGTTVMKTEFKISAPYAVSVGPSMRQIVDLSDPGSSFIVITTGESGQPLNRHYDDQTPLWLNGGYLRMQSDWALICSLPYDHLVLKP